MKQRTGAPAELVANSCGGMVSTVNTWLALWEVSHGIEGDQRDPEALNRLTGVGYQELPLLTHHVNYRVD